MKRIVLFCVVAIIVFQPLTISAQNQLLEPGPAFNAWIKINEFVERYDIDIIRRIYQHPDDRTIEGWTTSIRVEGSETLLLKVWDIDRKQNGGYGWKNMKAALRLPGGKWFVGETGKLPDEHIELGLWGYNLVIHVFKLDEKALQDCEEEKMRLKELGGDKDCDDLLYDKRQNGMYISIPARKYDK